jgi:hypothetical protein
MYNKYFKGEDQTNKWQQLLPSFSCWLWHMLSITCSRQYKWNGINCYLSYAEEQYNKIMLDNDLYKGYYKIYESVEGIVFTKILD